MTKTNPARKYLYDLVERIERAPEGTIAHTIASMFMNEIMEVQSIETQMRSELRTIIDRAERATKALDEGMNVNSLGEFHGAPADFDRLCSLRQGSWGRIARMVHMLNEDGLEIDMKTLRESIVAKTFI